MKSNKNSPNEYKHNVHLHLNSPNESKHNVHLHLNSSNQSTSSIQRIGPSQFLHPIPFEINPLSFQQLD